MTPVLYHFKGCNFCRSVQLTAHVLQVELQLREVDYFKGEHQLPEFLKLNPHHTLPVFVDQHVVLWESKAILAYLVDQYTALRFVSLYPSDPIKRAYVDQALAYDATTFYPTVRQVILPIIQGAGRPNENALKAVNETLEVINQDLGRSRYLAGNEAITIADLNFLSTWTSIEATGLWNTGAFANIQTWCRRIKQSGLIQNWDGLVVGGAKTYGKIIKEKLKSSRKSVQSSSQWQFSS